LGKPHARAPFLRTDGHTHISVFLSFHKGLQVEPYHLKCCLNFGLRDKIADIFWAVCGEAGGHALWPDQFISAVTRNSRIVATSAGRKSGIPLNLSSYLYEIAQVDTNQLIAQVQMRLLNANEPWSAACNANMTDFCTEDAGPSGTSCQEPRLVHCGDAKFSSTSLWQLESQTCEQNAEVIRASLRKAVETGDLEMVVKLRPGSKILNYCTEEESCLLFHAVLKARSTEMIRYFVHQGANIHARDHMGSGIMHLWARATRYGEILDEIGKLLIDLHADVNVQRYADGMTPMHHVAAGYSRRRNTLELCKAIFLRRHGASLSLQSTCGLPVDLIKSLGAKVKFTETMARLKVFSEHPITAAPGEDRFHHSTSLKDTWPAV